MKRPHFLKTACADARTALTLARWRRCASQAQDAYPSKTIRFVVPYPPGGPTDLMARLLAWSCRPGSAFGDRGQQGRRGRQPGQRARWPSKPPADGHTLLLAASGPMAVNATLYRSMPFNALTDLAPVIQISVVPAGAGSHIPSWASKASRNWWPAPRPASQT